MAKKYGKHHVLPQDKPSKKVIPNMRLALEPVKKGMIIRTADKRKFTDNEKAFHVSRYQIQYKKKGSLKWKTLNIKPAKTVNKKVLKLKRGAKYFVRSRAQVKVGKKWYSGKWTKIRAVKPK